MEALHGPGLTGCEHAGFGTRDSIHMKNIGGTSRLNLYTISCQMFNLGPFYLT